VRRGFLGRLPRPVRWLWFAILAVIGLECVGLALGFVFGEAWWWAAGQMGSFLAAPLALGLLLVAGTSAWVGRKTSPPEGGRSDEKHLQSVLPGPQVPLEVAAGRRAGEAVAALARSREGKEAIRQTAKLVRAVRAATRPASGSTGADVAERRSGSEP
jgi:hypothetical protein